jgi:hypothetical protein
MRTAFRTSLKSGPKGCFISVPFSQMPRGVYSEIERLAIEIVSDSERAAGNNPRLLGQHEQHVEGCDLISTAKDGGGPSRIEVKGWGEPLLGQGGSIAYPADINAEQFKRAKTDPDWRLEIVGNLSAVRAGKGQPQRLTLTGAETVERAEPWRYRISLHGLASRIG